MTLRIIPAIMSGGAGTRLWPLSTEDMPKQFHALGGAETLFASTLKRVSGSLGSLEFAPPLVLCNARHEALVRETLNGAPATLVLEPTPRNTAAAAVIAATIAPQIESGARVLLLPADHIVGDVAAFHGAVLRALAIAWDRIVTFGVSPSHAATEYGYIKRGGPIGHSLYEIESFREKPDAASARTYLEAGDYLWNTGVFLFHPRTLLEEFDAASDVREGAIEALRKSDRSGDVIALDAAAFGSVRSLPLDVAVMERTTRGAVVPCDFGWADVGSWAEVWRLAPRGADGFAVLGSAAESDTSKMEASGVKAFAVDGADLVVVAAPKGLLIVPSEYARDPHALRDLNDKL